MSIIQGTSKATAGDDSFYPFEIGQSLRFDGSSYLSRSYTTVATEGKKGTLSLWIKITNFSDIRRTLLGAYASPGSDSSIELGATAGPGATHINSVYYSHGRTNSSYITSVEKLRDGSAWYHLTFVWDTTVPKTYTYIHNKITTNAGETVPLQDELSRFFGNGFTTYIGSNSTGNGSYFEGYMAEINFIDGQALDPYFFGEFKNGSVWIPYNAFSTAGSGTATASDGDTATDSYGTNGFRLSFSDATSTTTLGYDSSGNSNHWTLN